MRVQTKGTSAEELLAGAPLAIRSFKVDLTYTYQISKEVDVTVLPLPKQEIPITHVGVPNE